MADYPPFMNAYGAIPKILEKVKEAKTPARFTQDYLASTLGFKGGTYKPFIPLAKRIGLLSSDGTPTEIYNRFRDANHTKGAMAEAMRRGYSDLFTRNENVFKLEKQALEGLVIQATGLDRNSSTLRSIVASFLALKAFANFEAPSMAKVETKNEDQHDNGKAFKEARDEEAEGPKLNLSYNINLNLPKSDDPAVFNAIFKALREHLLKP